MTMLRLSTACPLCMSKARVVPFPVDKNKREFLNCGDCGLLFVPQRLHLDAAAEKSRYEHHKNDPTNEGYVQFLSTMTIHLVPKLMQLRADRGGASASLKGLDYGCGPGKPTLSGMLMSDQRCAPLDMDVYDPYFAPDSAERSILSKREFYDFITCTEVAEHFCQPGEDFDRLDTLLRPGGWLGVMTEMVHSDEQFRNNWWYARDPTHVSFYRPQTMHWIGAKYNWDADVVCRNLVLFHKRQTSLS